MKSVLRATGCLLIAVATVLLLRSWVWAPLVCGRATAVAIRSTRTAENASTYRSALIARANLRSLQGCKGVCTDAYVETAIVRAINLRMIGRAAEAAAVCREALRYAQRPELYVNLGNALAETGERDAAFEALMRGCTFAPGLTGHISDGELRLRVEAAVAAREQSLKAKGAQP